MQWLKGMMAMGLVVLATAAGCASSGGGTQTTSTPAQRAEAADDTAERLKAAALAMQEIMQVPDKGIPQDLLSKARCIVVVPSLKEGAFVVGAQYGKGFMSCRQGNSWSAPAAVRVEGGSVGFQIGASETEVVMLVLNEKGVDRLLSSQFTLGADATVAAGPVGRRASAQTDAAMTAEILTWSRSRGLFAGVALDGATLRPDDDSNRAMYGRAVTSREIVQGTIAAPAIATPFMAELKKY